MSLLTAVNRAQRRLSLTVTSAVVADGQETQNLLFQLANDAAEDLVQRKNWPLLRRSQSFTASLASLQSSGKASNYDRAIEGTFWNATRDREIAGPLSNQEWALANGQPFTSSIEQYAMFRYDGLHIFPAPTVADTITYEYMISTPVLAVDGTTYKAAFTADTDTFVMGDRLLYLELRWRYLADKGRDYAEAMRDSEIALNQEFERQRGAPRALAIAPPDMDEMGAPLIPETGFGA